MLIEASGRNDFYFTLTSVALLAIASGANTNFDRLRYISERTEIGEKREIVLSVSIPEKPGSFKAFCSALGKRAITEFNYRYAAPHENGDREAHIFVGLKVAEGYEDVEQVIAPLRDKGYPVTDLTDNELAKLHVRHMVGGPTPGGLDNEMVFRVEFPERPGALLNFLTRLGQRWNISMFHYRSHGAAYGRVLVGMQVESGERKAVREAMESTQYRYWDETDNRAYQLYLGQRPGADQG